MLRKIIQRYIMLLQKVFITITLFFLYIIGFGFTLFFVSIFSRRLLGKTFTEENTFWNEAKEYEADINSSMRQS